MAEHSDQPRSCRAICTESPVIPQSSTTMKSQTEKLIDMTGGYVLKQEKRSKLESFLFYLKSQRLRNSASMLTFYRYGGVDSLLQLSRNLQKNSDDDSSLLGLVWGTLANLCAFDMRIQRKVVLSAIPDICESTTINAHFSKLVVTVIQWVLCPVYWRAGEILINCPYPKVLNTVSRALANLTSCISLSPSYKGNEIVIIREITRILNLYSDSGCLQSVLRLLRKLCCNGELNEELKMTQTIVAVSNTLNLNDTLISTAALKTLEAFTGTPGNCDLVPDLWTTTTGNTPLRILVQFVPQCTVSTSLMDMTISLLCRCARHVDGKAALSRAGGIEVLVDFITQDCPKDSALYFEVLEVLCLCCRDVQGRQKMRDSNGLQLLIKLIHDEEFTSHHEDLLSALICYYFDEHTLRYMVRHLSLMKSLTHHLIQITEQLKKQSTSSNSSNTQPEAVIDCRDARGDSCSDVLLHCDDKEPEKSLSAFDSDVDESLLISFDPAHSLSSSPVSLLSVVTESSSIQADNLEGFSSTSNETMPEVTSPLYMPNSSVDTKVGFRRCSSSIDNTAFLDSTQFLEEDFLKSCSSMNTLTTPHKNITLDINESTPIPANFIDSLLSSSTPYSSDLSASLQSPVPLLSDTQDSLESKILLLISRLSHLHDCQPILATSETLLAILEYFLAADRSNSVQSFKILSRIFINPNCFQDCIKNHAPSLIFKHIYTQSEQSVSPPSLLSEPHHSPVTPSLISSRKSMCSELFEKLSRVAESPYGQGVVAHMLLRGDDKEVTAGTLALSLLQKSRVVCHKMLTSYNGLHNLLCLSQGKTFSRNDTATPPLLSDDVCEQSLQDCAMITLLCLANRYHTHPINKRRRSTIHPDEDTEHLFSAPLSKKARLDESDCLHSRLVNCLLPSNHNSKPVPRCQYMDTDHCPFDLLIKVGSKGKVRQFPVHRYLLVESSEVFAVMLGGLYQESNQREIPLHDISPSVFSTYIHHMYSCPWPCREDRERIQAECLSSQLEDTHENMFSCILIKEIVKSLDSPTDKQLVVHYLLLLECVNRYYRPSLVSLCEDKLGPFVSEGNLVPMFLFASMHQSHRLSCKCVFELTALQDGERQCEMMRELLHSSDASNFLEIIKAFFHAPH